MVLRAQEDDDGSNRSHTVPWPESGEEGQRREGQGERKGDRHGPYLGNRTDDKSSPDRSTLGSHEPIKDGFERASYAGLHDDDGTEHRPVGLGQTNQLTEREAGQTSYSDAKC